MNFFLLQLIFVAFIAVGYAQHQPAAQFPAGVDPAKCPNFPICDNAALHNQQPQGQWNQWNAPQPQQNWNAPQPQWNAPQPQQNWNAPQPQWNAPQPQWNAPQPQQNWNAPAVYGPQSNHLSAGGDK